MGDINILTKKKDTQENRILAHNNGLRRRLEAPQTPWSHRRSFQKSWAKISTTSYHWSHQSRRTKKASSIPQFWNPTRKIQRRLLSRSGCLFDSSNNHQTRWRWFSQIFLIRSS